MKYLLTLYAVFLSSSSFAMGTLTFSAKVESFDNKTVTLQMANSDRIKIAKSLLTKEQDNGLKPGATIELQMDEKQIAASKIKSKK